MKLNVPERLELRSEQIALSIFDPDNGPRTFDMLAYTGAVFDVGFGPAVIDLRGCEVPEGGVPIFRQHDPNKFVGRSHEILCDGANMRIRGVLFDNADGSEVASLSDQGAQWQASVGVAVDLEAAEFIEAGAQGAANGVAFDGPVLVLRKTKLRESSFVPLGADSNTSAVALCDAPVVSLEFSTAKEADMAEMETVKALTEEFASDPAFALEAIRSGWSLADAKAKFADKVAAQNAARVAELEAELAAKLEEAEQRLADQQAAFEAKLAAASKAAPAAAIAAPASGAAVGGLDLSGLDARSQWDALLAAECDRLQKLGSNGHAHRELGLSREANIRSQAVENVATKHPEIHQAYLAAFNGGR